MPTPTIRLSFNEQEYIMYLKHLLSLEAGGSFEHRTVQEHLIILSRADKKKVQKAIYEWLNVPQRKADFEGK